jgi:hypothetical protein
MVSGTQCARKSQHTGGECVLLHLSHKARTQKNRETNWLYRNTLSPSNYSFLVILISLHPLWTLITPWTLLTPRDAKREPLEDILALFRSVSWILQSMASTAKDLPMAGGRNLFTFWSSPEATSLR